MSLDQVSTSIIQRLAKSHAEMTTIVEQEKWTALHACNVICALPDHPEFNGGKPLALKQALKLFGSVGEYLGGLADLEDAVAERTAMAFGELSGEADEE